MSTPSNDLASSSGEASTARSARHQLVFLVVGLVLFAVLWAVPLAFAIWGFGFMLGGVGVAELLERTRGFVPTTYGGAFWLAIVLTVVMAVLEVRAMFRDGPRHRSYLIRFMTRPSTAFLVLFVPTLLLVRIDIRGTDVPDILTTTLLLCCLGYLWFILPLALAAVSWRLTRWMWTLGSGSGFAAGLLGMLGISFASCMPVVCAAGMDDEAEDRTHAIDEAFEDGFDEIEDQGLVDGTRALMVGLAEVIDEKPKAASTPTRSKIDPELFEDCVQRLLAGGSNSLRDRKITAFVRSEGLDRAVAEDIVQDAVLKLCVHQATIGLQPYPNVEAVFNLRANDRRKNWERDRKRRKYCVVARRLDELDHIEEPIYVESRRLDAALCKLDELDRQILVLAALDHDAKWIGEELGLTQVNVRQRKRRALEKVRNWLQLH